MRLTKPYNYRRRLGDGLNDTSVVHQCHKLRIYEDPCFLNSFESAAATDSVSKQERYLRDFLESRNLDSEFEPSFDNMVDVQAPKEMTEQHLETPLSHQTDTVEQDRETEAHVAKVLVHKRSKIGYLFGDKPVLRHHVSDKLIKLWDDCWYETLSNLISTAGLSSNFSLSLWSQTTEHNKTKPIVLVVCREKKDVSLLRDVSKQDQWRFQLLEQLVNEKGELWIVRNRDLEACASGDSTEEESNSITPLPVDILRVTGEEIVVNTNKDRPPGFGEAMRIRYPPKSQWRQLELSDSTCLVTSYIAISNSIFGLGVGHVVRRPAIQGLYESHDNSDNSSMSSSSESEIIPSPCDAIQKLSFTKLSNEKVQSQSPGRIVAYCNGLDAVGRDGKLVSQTTTRISDWCLVDQSDITSTVFVRPAPDTVFDGEEVSINISETVVLKGRLKKTKSRIRMQGALYNVREVITDRPIRPGESGASVVKNSMLYGMIVATTGLFSVAYMIPICHVIESISTVCNIPSSDIKLYTLRAFKEKARRAALGRAIQVNTSYSRLPRSESLFKRPWVTSGSSSQTLILA